MEVVLDVKTKCLCCDRTVYTTSEIWNRVEAPIALCRPCAGSVPMSMVRVIYLMRCQIKTLFDEQQTDKRDIKRLFTAQKDLEQDFLQ